MSFAPEPRAAQAYDRWFEYGWGKFAFERECELLLKAAGPVRGSHVLDVGSGTGRFISRLIDEGATAVGTDADPVMVSQAGEKGLADVIVGDAMQLPFADQAFYMAFAVTVCEFLDDVDAVFSEWRESCDRAVVLSSAA